MASEFNYIGIDPSLASTAITIKLKDGTVKYFNFVNHTKCGKWYKILNFIKYVSYSIPKSEEFSKGEILKLLGYVEIINYIISEIKALCEPEETIIYMESFSYSSRVGPLIDLVTYSTILKDRLLDHGFSNLTVVPPTSLKAAVCLYVYGPGENKKASRNDEGLAGGSFSKREMIKSGFDHAAILDNYEIFKKLHPYRLELLKKKSPGKPAEDAIDATWLCILAEHDHINDNI